MANEVSWAPPRFGRPRKHKDGYCNAVKVIRVLQETFLQWRKLKAEKNLPDDDSVALYLLDSLQRATSIFDVSKY